MTIDAKKKLAVTPASRRMEVGKSPCRVFTRPNTRYMVPRAPANAAMDKVEIPRMVKLRPRLMAITAPNEAPLETPRVNGAAKSFLNRAWKTAPVTDRAAPVTAPRRMRGMRARNRMLASTLSVAPIPPDKALPMSMEVGPIKGAMIRVARNIRKNRPIPVANFRELMVVEFNSFMRPPVRLSDCRPRHLEKF